MTDSVLDIQTISINWRNRPADRVLKLGQIIGQKEKAYQSHFFKFLLPTSQMALTFLLDEQADSQQNQISRFFTDTFLTSILPHGN